MAEIVPSILVKQPAELVTKLELITGYSVAFHLDIADGIFVPNTTIDGVSELADLTDDWQVTVHLMVAKPENHIARWLATGVERIIFHCEATEQITTVVSLIREGERLVSPALNPQTPLTKIADFVELVDGVHFLTVEPGFYGGEFVPAVVEKIQEFHYLYPDKFISVDGGVNPTTAPQLIVAGADELIVGSFLFNAPTVGDGMEAIREAIAPLV